MWGRWYRRFPGGGSLEVGRRHWGPETLGVVPLLEDLEDENRMSRSRWASCKMAIDLDWLGGLALKLARMIAISSDSPITKGLSRENRTREWSYRGERFF